MTIEEAQKQVDAWIKTGTVIIRNCSPVKINPDTINLIISLPLFTFGENPK